MRVTTALRILLRAGPLALLDRTITRLRENIYVWDGRDYGLREALLFPDGYQVDLWTRYSRVARVLRARLPPPPRRWRVLEVGSGGAGLAGFSRDRELRDRLDLVVVDHDAYLIGSVRRARPVLADALKLPFPARSFDAVLALDIFEHIPAAPRREAVEEIKRVARHLVICHCPVEGPDEQFVGRSSDCRFGDEFRRRYDAEPPGWVREHLGAGHPTPEELRSLFPGCELSGDQNQEVWLRYMLAGEPRTGRASRFLTGFRYARGWRKEDSKPPFRSGLVVWTRSTG